MISIAIPYYKNKEYLKESIESVFSQTSADWHLYVVDDAGPEGDLKDWFIQNWPDHYGKIHYFRNSTNLGMAENWNHCLSIAKKTSQWVTLLHSDDLLAPHYVELMNRAIRTTPESTAALFCGASVVDENGKSVFSFPDWYKTFLTRNSSRSDALILEGDQGASKILKGNFIFCPTLCYNLDTLGQEKFNKKWKMVLDLDLLIRLLENGKRLLGLPSLGYYYRRHSENATTEYTNDLSRFSEEIQIYNEISERAKKRGWERTFEVSRNKKIITLHIMYRIVQKFLRFEFDLMWKTIYFFMYRNRPDGL